MIALYTDFGVSGYYVGQLKAVLLQHAPSVPVIDLMHDAPTFDPQAAAYLLAALVKEFPPHTVFLCVVDPGVGSQRKPMIVKAGQQWFVGPDNGLFTIVMQQALPKNKFECWDINWQPQRLSATFHGRDLFAPVAAKLANNGAVPGESRTLDTDNMNVWPGDLHKIIYVDHFGNAVSGVRADGLFNTKASTNASTKSNTGVSTKAVIVNDHLIPNANTFSDVAVGQGFWYQNANGLVEIAVNQGRADQQFRLSIGSTIRFV